MATLFSSPAFLCRLITKTTNHISSSSSSSSQPQTTPLASELLKTTSEEIIASPATAKVQQQQQQQKTNYKPATSTSTESNDWVPTTLTRRFGLGAGLACASFLAIGGLSEQINTQLQVSQRTRNVDKEEEVILSNGIRYYDLKVGGGASARPGDMVVIEVKGKVQDSGALFVGTLEGGKKPLAVLMGSRPYSKGICEGIECVLRTMKAGGKRKVIIPPSLGFGDDGADLGSGFQIPPASTLEYVIEVQNVSIPSA